MTGTAGRVRLLTTRAELAAELERIRGRGEALALVPTMGALHEGHLTLLDRAGARADRTALSIFVNPLQFGPGEDLDRYPRPLDRDLRLAEQRGVDLVFAPSIEEMFPGGAPTVQVTPGPMGDRLCGAFRPGHFQGVLTVVASLFGLFRPDVAVFGRKDFQQAVLIRRMAAELKMGVEIEVAPLVREADGVAYSSRNAFLSPPEREQARGLFQALGATEEAFRSGIRDGRRLEATARDRLAAFPGLMVEYVAVVDPDRLDPVGEAVPGDVVAMAARVGRTRLIDNRPLGAAAPDPVIGSGS